MNKFEYKNLTPFKWFVLENFPFIEADFDALTEWQLFCKLGKEINKIIDSQNVVGTEMEKFSQAFIELKNYVNNYFDNLDVQDEINNKLNEMASNGELQQVFKDYLSNFEGEQNQKFNEFQTNINNILQTQDNKINQLVSATPQVVNSTSEMIDTNKIYILSSDKNWYYYKNGQWTSGGVYQGETIPNNSIDFSKIDNEFFNAIQNSLNLKTFENGNYYFPIKWELGNIDIKTGQNAPVLPQPTTLRTTNFLNANNFKTLNLNIFNNFNVVILTYDINYNFIKILNSYNSDGTIITYNKNTVIDIDGFYYFKVIMANKTYSTSISLSDSVNVNIYSYFNNNFNYIKDLISSFSNIKGVDLTWTLGGLDLDNGTERESPTLIRTDFINCNSVERFKIDNLASSFMIFYYDSYKNFISHTKQYLWKQGYVFTIPKNASYLRIILGDIEHELSIQNGNLLFLTFINNDYFKNKRLAILGDSISTYEGITPSDKANAFYPKGDMQDVNNTYWKLLQNALSLQLITNNSYSSSTVCSPNTQYTSFCDNARLENLGNPDIIIVEGGTNDIYTGKNSSNIDSFNISDYDISKFSDAYAYVIRKLQELYPWAKIICITPCFIVNNETYNRPNCTYQRINDICDNIITLCKHLGATPIDLRTSGINMGNILNTTVDGLHWNMIGHSLVANLILEKLLN